MVYGKACVSQGVRGSRGDEKDSEMKKAHGKGRGISIGGTNHVNTWKGILAHASEGLPVIEWKPLKVERHPRQDDMDAFRQIPSRYA